MTESQLAHNQEQREADRITFERQWQELMLPTAHLLGFNSPATGRLKDLAWKAWLLGKINALEGFNR